MSGRVSMHGAFEQVCRVCSHKVACSSPSRACLVGGLLEAGQQEQRQQVMAEVVGHQVVLKALLRQLVRSWAMGKMGTVSAGRQVHS